MKLIRKLGFSILLLTVSNFVLAASKTRIETGTLTCGNSVLTAKTTYLDITGSIDPQVVEQRLILRNIKTNNEKELKIDGKYVIKHVPEDRKLLDAAIEVWGCLRLRQEQEKYIIVFIYYCTNGGGKDICKEPKIEFTRFLQEDGSPLFKSPRHWKVGYAEDALYKSLGIDKAEIIESKDINDD